MPHGQEWRLRHFVLGLATKKPKNDKENCSYICLEIEFSKPKWNLPSSFYGSQINSHL